MPGARRLRAEGGKVTGDLPIINGFAAKLPAGAVDELQDADGLKAVTVDDAVKPQGISLSRLQTAYPASVDAPQAWNNPIADVSGLHWLTEVSTRDFMWRTALTVSGSSRSG